MDEFGLSASLVLADSGKVAEWRHDASVRHVKMIVYQSLSDKNYM